MWVGESFFRWASAVVFSWVLALGVPSADAAEDFSALYPMVQLPTSGSHLPLTVQVPREQNFVFHAVAVDGPGGASRKKKLVQGKVRVVSNFEEPNKLLEKVLRVEFTDLSPNTWYEIRMYEERFGKPDKTPVDVRYARTLDPKASQLRFALGSCMSDELRYRDAARKIWTRVWEQKPNLIVLTGDLVYVDAFDYTKRQDVNNSVVWQRFFHTFATLPLYRAKNLIPVFATPDDHDAGINDSHSETAVLPEAMRAFNAFYVGPDLPGVHESNPAEASAVYRRFTHAGQKIYLLDNRSGRLADETGAGDRYGHYSREQEDWLIKTLGEDSRPAFLLSGDQWTAPKIVSGEKVLNEGLYSSHPVQFEALMKRIWETGNTVVFGAGDVHFSEITRMGPVFQNTPDYAPYETVELTASPMHSFIFAPKKGEPILWPRTARLSPPNKEYSFMLIESKVDQETGLKTRATIYGVGEEPITSYSFHVDANSGHLPKLGRRKLRKDGYQVVNGKVKVAVFDKDLTLADTNDGSRVANRIDQIEIMKGRSEKIAELAAQGYLIAVASNQAGVEHDIITLEQADQIVLNTIERIEAQHPGAKFHYYDLAEYGGSVLMRKPHTGMLLGLEMALAQQGLQIDWDQSFYVGDAKEKKGEDEDGDGILGNDFNSSDRRCAENLARQKGVKFKFLYAPEFFQQPR